MVTGKSIEKQSESSNISSIAPLLAVVLLISSASGEFGSMVSCSSGSLTSDASSWQAVKLKRAKNAKRNK